MLEKLAQNSFRYYVEARVFIVFTLALFGVATLYSYYGNWVDGQGLGTLLLFLGVYGNVILAVFCLCVLYMSFLYAFHPGLNGKEKGQMFRVHITRLVCTIFALGTLVLLFQSFFGHPLH